MRDENDPEALDPSDPIDAAAAEARRRQRSEELAKQRAAERRAREEEAARRERARGGSAITASDDGRQIELRTTMSTRLLFSPLGVLRLSFVVMGLVGTTWLGILAISGSVEGDHTVGTEQIRALLGGVAGFTGLLTLAAFLLWRRLGHFAPISVRVTANGNAGLFRRGKLLATCSPSGVTFRIIERATIWTGRDHWVGKCRITAFEGKIYGSTLRVFGLTEADTHVLEAYANRHGMKVQRDKFGSTGGSSVSYEDRGLWAT